MTKANALPSCHLCGQAPTITNGYDRWPWCAEYWCHIQCPEHKDVGVAGTSIDNAIDAQRAAEAAWIRLQAQQPRGRFP